MPKTIDAFSRSTIEGAMFHNVRIATLARLANPENSAIRERRIGFGLSAPSQFGHSSRFARYRALSFGDGAYFLCPTPTPVRIHAIMNSTFDFDVALSFAGEDRPYVDRVANALRDRGVKVFYDLFEEADLWGKDLYSHLSDIYQKRARFTVMFISDAYGKKLWTNHERRAAQARAFQESQEYILPARFDGTEIPGVLPTVGYISLSSRSPEDFASIVTRKLVSSGGSVPTELVRNDFSTASVSTAGDPTRFVVQVCDDEGSPIEGASATLQADNGTTINGHTDNGGRCSLEVKTRRTFRLLIAHPAFPAAIIDQVDAADSARVTLPRTDNVGSGIIHDSGYIPGLKGRLNPILDASSRTHLYADNVAIDGGKAQPATFAINQPIKLEDADGTVVYVTVKHIAARVALVQFSRRPKLASNPAI